MDADGKLSGGVNMEGIKYYNNLINKLISEGKGYTYFFSSKKKVTIPVTRTRMTPVPDPNRDGYGTDIFFSPVGNLTGT
jgi:hypothetical protein